MEETKRHSSQLHKVGRSHIDNEVSLQVKEIPRSERLRANLFVFSYPDFLKTCVNDVTGDHRLLFDFFLIPQHRLQISAWFVDLRARKSSGLEDEFIVYVHQQLRRSAHPRSRLRCRYKSDHRLRMLLTKPVKHIEDIDLCR